MATIEIGGESYEIRYTVNAVRDMERHLGVSAFEVLGGGSLTLDAVQALLWAGLRHQAPRLTPDQAGLLLDQYFDEGGSLEDLVTGVLGPAYAEWLTRLVKRAPNVKVGTGKE